MANADVFNSMMGGGPGTPSQASMREPSVDTSIREKETVNPVWMGQEIKPGFYRGKGGYEYIVGGQGEITIAKSPIGKAGTVVELDNPYYDFIAKELAGKQNEVSGIPAQVQARLKAASAPPAPKPPSGRAPAAEKEAYGDRLLGDMATAGQYGSASKPVTVAYTDGETFTTEGPDIEAPAKGQYGSMGALREAEASTSAAEMARGKEVAGAVISEGEAAKRKEIAGYTASDMQSTMKRAALSDAAKARLMKFGLPEKDAAAVVRNLMAGVTDMKSMDSLRSLQALAGP